MPRVLCTLFCLFALVANSFAEISEKPSPRSGFSMAYDTSRNVLVLHGGIVPGGRLQDTWEWDGSTWTKLN